MDGSDEYINFTLLGENFTIKSDVPKDYVLNLVDYFERRNKSIKVKLPNLSNLRLAILSTLDIIDELFRLKENANNIALDSKAVKLISDLSESLASVIEEDGIKDNKT